MIPKKTTKEVKKNKNSKIPEAFNEVDPQKVSENTNSVFPLPEESLEIIQTFKKKGKKND